MNLYFIPYEEAAKWWNYKGVKKKKKVAVAFSINDSIIL